MLSVNDFPIIKEIQSLCSQKLDIEKTTKSELLRVIKVKELKDENTQTQVKVDSELLEKNIQVKHLENEIIKKSQTLTRKKEQLLMATSDKQLESFKNEISNLSQTIDSLEVEALEMLELIDPLHEKQKELIDFFNNIDDSIQEIEQTVMSETTNLKSQVDVLKDRIELLIQELSPVAQSKIKHIMKSELIPFLTILKNQSCANCGMNMPSENMTHILNMTKLISCSGCSRLIIE